MKATGSNGSRWYFMVFDKIRRFKMELFPNYEGIGFSFP